MILRDFETKDSGQIGHLFRNCVLHGTSRFYSTSQREAWAGKMPDAKAWSEKLTKMDCVVAEDAGTIVGFFAIDDGGHVSYAYVAHTHMEQGLGDLLYKRLLEKSSAHHLTTEASHFAKSFFLRHGWKVDLAQTVHRNGVDIENFKMSINLRHTKSY